MDQEPKTQTTAVPDEVMESARNRERKIDLTGKIVNRIGALDLPQLEALQEALKVIDGKTD